MIIIKGEPVGKQRPRFGNGRTYTPAKTVHYETMVGFYAQEQGVECEEGPVSIGINAFFTIPKSASKVKRSRMEAGLMRPTKKPDIDNIIKAILDGLNGIAYKDDAQVVEVRCRKWWSEDPRVEIEIQALEVEG